MVRFRMLLYGSHLPLPQTSQGRSIARIGRRIEIAEQYAAWARNRNNLDMRAGIYNTIIPKTTVECAIKFYSREHWQQFVHINCLIPTYKFFVREHRPCLEPSRPLPIDSVAWQRNSACQRDFQQALHSVFSILTHARKPARKDSLQL